MGFINDLPLDKRSPCSAPLRCERRHEIDVVYMSLKLEGMMQSSEIDTNGGEKKAKSVI